LLFGYRGKIYFDRLGRLKINYGDMSSDECPRVAEFRKIDARQLFKTTQRGIPSINKAD